MTKNLDFTINVIFRTSKINQASVKQNCMIIVDCKDVEPILNELAIYVSDQVAAVPALKAHQFVLSPIEDDEQINQSEVIASIKEFLESIGEKQSFGVISNSNKIMIKSILGKKIEREAKPTGQMFSCAHCGHVTRYEVEHNNHVRIHYL
mgnify:CR=1 FL=1